MTIKHRRVAQRRLAEREPRRVSPYEIPTVNDYRHWGEQAHEVWYAENRYDMEHPEAAQEAWEEEMNDRGDRYDEPEGFSDMFDTEEKAQAFAKTCDGKPYVMQWGRKGEEKWYVDHFDEAAHERWLHDV